MPCRPHSGSGNFTVYQFKNVLNKPLFWVRDRKIFGELQILLKTFYLCAFSGYLERNNVLFIRFTSSISENFIVPMPSQSFVINSITD